MPTLTIYVKDEDVEVFDKAKSLEDEGSLSKILAKSLRDYLIRREYRMYDMEEIDLSVGEEGVRTVRFIGRLLASAPDHSLEIADGKEWYDDLMENGPIDNNRWDEHFRVYQTKKGKLLLYNIHPFESRYCLYDTLEELKNVIEEKFNGHPIINDLYRELGDEAIEFLDI